MSNKINKVYLSGPIDGVPLGESRKWRLYAAKKLMAKGIEVYDPTKNISNKFIKTKKALMDFPLEKVEPTINERGIVRRDLLELSKCSIVLCYVILKDQLESKKIPLGTFVELGAAFLGNQPIVGVTNCLKGRPFWEGIVDKSFNNLDEALDCVIQSVEGFKIAY